MNIFELIAGDTGPVGVIGSPSDTFEAVVDILEISAEDKLLGELVYFLVPEGKRQVLALGQVTDIKTENKWHEEPSFKAVIKRHGKLPHLSGVADNRIAKITVQSTFNLGVEDEPVPHKLANSPSTGELVRRMNDPLMDKLLAHISKNFKLFHMGKAYGTDVRIPFWFKHFGEGQNGAGDAYHIGVFGRTGSGKTSTAARMVCGYASNNKDMSILILDPQEQFYIDSKVLPDKIDESGNRKQHSFKEEIEGLGMQFRALKVPDDIYFSNDAALFAELLNSSGFIEKTFNLKSVEKQQLMQDSIADYIESRKQDPHFDLAQEQPQKLLVDMLTRFNTHKSKSEQAEKCSYYISNVYAKGQYRNNLSGRVSDNLDELVAGKSIKNFNLWDAVLKLFKSQTGKISIDTLVHDVINKPGFTYILNISGRGSLKLASENLQALIIQLIGQKVIEYGEDLYSKGKKSNCLLVMDEAHRYISSNSGDPRIRELTKHIIDSVRTTRKYGVGYMFITQTIESLDDEILQQMRIFSFGYGLTIGKEFRTIKDIIGDDNAAKFYRSFIDPSSNGKYPFMFHGPISPLSFTGSPLFIEMA